MRVMVRALIAAVALTVVLLPAPVDAALAQASQTCLVSQPGGSTCGVPTDLVAGGGGVTVTILLKGSGGASCVPCDTSGGVTATLSGVAADSITCLTSSSDGICNIQWTLVKVAGNVTLAVTVNGQAAQSSPYTVPIGPADDGVQSGVSQSSISFPGGTAGGPVDTDLTFSFTLKDEYGNFITSTSLACTDLVMAIQLVGVPGVTKSVACSGPVNGVFTGTYRATQNGNWTVIVTGSTGVVARGTATLTSSGARAAQSTVVVDNNNPPLAAAQGVLTLVARDSFGNILDAASDPGVAWGLSVAGYTALDGGSSTTPPLTFNTAAWQSGGRYTVSFQSTRSGQYSVRVTIGADVVGGAGAVTAVKIEPARFSGAVMAPTSQYASPVANVPTTFSVRGVDQYGNAHSTGIVALTAVLTRAGWGGSPRTLATAAGAGGATAVSLQLTMSGEYSLALTMTDTGQYQGTASVGTSPYSVGVLPDEAGLPTRFQFSPSAAALTSSAGTAVALSIREVDVYGNLRTVANQSFAVLLSGPQTAAANVTDSGAGAYALGILLTRTGAYTVAVTHTPSNTPIPTDAFALQVGPGSMSAPGTIRNSYPGFDGGGAGSVDGTARFAIRAGDAYGNEISTGGLASSVTFTMRACAPTTAPCAANAAAWGTHAGSTAVVDGGGGFYGLSYTTTVAGYYAGEIKYNGAQIYLSPSSLFVAAGTTVAGSSYAYGPGLASCGHVLVAGELSGVVACLNASGTAESTFAVRLVDHFGNERISSSGITDVLVFNTSSVSTLYHYNASGTLAVASNKLSVQQTNGVQVVGFIATISGRYSTAVTHRTCTASGCPNPVDTGPISNTPVFAFVAPAPAYAPYSFPTGNGLSIATAGIASTFAITTRDAFLNRRVGVVSAVGDDAGWALEAAFNSVGARTAGSVTGQASGEYVASYTCTAAGPYSLSVRRDGAGLASALGSNTSQATPYAVTVFPNVAAGPSRVTSGAVVRGTAGAATTVMLNAFDAYGNAKSRGGDVFTGLVGALPLTTVTQTDVGNGSHAVNFFVTKAGTFSVNVRVNGTDVVGSPLSVAITPGPTVPRNSEVVPRSITTAGIPLTFLIKSRDEFYNVRSVGGDAYNISCSMPSDASVAVVPVFQDWNNGSYLAYCMLLKAGAYSVTVTARNTDGSYFNVSGSPFPVAVEPGVADPRFSAAVGVATSLATAGAWSTFQIFARDRFFNPNTGASAATFFMRVKREVNGTNVTVPFCPPSDPSPEWGNVTKYPVDVLAANTTAAGTCTSVDVGQGSFRMSYFWTVSGTYHADVTIDTGNGLQLPIRDPELTLRVVAADFYVAHSTAMGVAYSYGTAGESMRFLIQGRDRYENLRTSAGGVFEVSIVSNATGQTATVESTDNGNGTFTVAYEGTTIGAYTISVQMASVHILNSPNPLTLLPARSAPAEFFVIGGAFDGGSVDTNVTFSIRAADRFRNLKTQGGDRVEVLLTGGWMTALDGSSFANASSVYGRVHDLGTGTYVCTYTVLRSGAFAVAVRVADPLFAALLSIRGSPFAVTVLSGPISAARTVALYLNASSNAPVVLGPGVVHDVRISDEYRSFTILAKDRFGNPRLEGGNDKLFLVVMRYAGPAGAVGVGNEGLSLNLTVPVAYRGGPNATAHLSSGEYVAAYPATVAGRYVVEARYNGSLIQSSGHAVRLIPGGIFSETTSTLFPLVMVDGRPSSRVSTAGVQATFTVLARDFYGNRLTTGGAQLSVDVRGNSSDNSWVSFRGEMENATRFFRWTPAAQAAGISDPACGVACVSDAGDGSYVVVIKPTISGSYAVTVGRGPTREPICQAGCRDVLLNPYTYTTLAADVYAPFCNAYGMGLSAAAAGVEGNFFIQARDQFGNKRTTSRYNPLTGDYNGEFFASSVSFDGLLLTPDKCSCTLGVCTMCTAVSCITNACGTQMIGYPKVSDNRNGVYSVAYKITQAARYTLAIRKALGTELLHISGSPFPIDMTSGPTDPLSCTAIGEATNSAMAGVMGSVVIQARDFYGNLRGVGGDPIRAVAQHTEVCTPDGLGGCATCAAGDDLCTWAGVAATLERPLFVEALVKDLGNGDYMMNYTLTRSGFYLLNIKLNTTHIGGRTVYRSPFALTCSPAALDPSQSTVTGDGARLVTVLVESSFLLWPRDRFGNNLAGSRERVQIIICNTGETCGPRFGAAFLAMRVYNKGTGKWHDVRDKFNPGRTDTDPTKGTTILAEVRANADASSSFMFVMPEVGDYTIFVDFQGVPIKGTPLNMTVFPLDKDPFPPLSSVVPGDDFLAGRTGRGLLTVRNQYGIKIPSVTPRDVSLAPYANNPSRVQPTAVNLMDGTFYVTFSATRAGRYSIGVGVTNPGGSGYVDVPGSPVVMNVLPYTFDPPSSVAFVTQLKEVVAGQVISFSVRNRDAYGNELASNAGINDAYAATMVRVGGGGEILTASITPTSPVGYIASFAQAGTGTSLTTRSGAYRLTVTNLGFGVVNSPFDINVLPAAVDAAQCTVTSAEARVMTAGEYANVYIQAKDRYGNNRTSAGDTFVVSKAFNASLPAPLLQSVQYQAAGITRAALMFERVGAYVINVRLGGVDVRLSPFTSLVVPNRALARNCFNTTAVPHYSTAGDVLSFTIQAADAFGNLHTAQQAVFDVSLRGFDFLRTYVNGAPCTAADGRCVRIAYAGGGRYTVGYTPIVAGEYLMAASLRSAAGALTPIGVAGGATGSPYRRCPTCATLLVTPSDPSISTSIFTGGGVSRFASGVLATFTLFARDVFNNSQITGGSVVTGSLAGGFPFSRKELAVEDQCSPSAQDLCGQYSLSYLQTVSGVYSLTVTLDGQTSAPMTIQGFPNLSPDPAATGLLFSGNIPPICNEVCGNDQCCLLGEAASYGLVGVQNEFVIAARDKYGNQATAGGESFSVEIVGKTRGEGVVLDLGTGQYIVRYRVLVKGVYTLSVRMRGIHIGLLYDDCEALSVQCFRGSPYTNLDMSPKGTGLEGIIFSSIGPGVVSTTYQVNVNTQDGAAQRTLERDALQATLQLYQRDTVLRTERVTINSPNKEQYILSYSTNTAGLWSLSVTSGDVHAVGSPFSVMIQAGDADPTKTKISGPQPPKAMGALRDKITIFFITTVDRFGNERTSLLVQDQVRYGVVPDGQTLNLFAPAARSATRENFGDYVGKYRAFFTVSTTGAHRIFTWVASQSTGDARLVNVYAAAGVSVPDNTEVWGTGLEVGTAGVPLTFSIEMRDSNFVKRDAGGEVFRVVITDVAGQATEYGMQDVRDNADGTYVFSTTLNVALPYSITLGVLGASSTYINIVKATSQIRVYPASPDAGSSVFTADYPWLIADGLASRTATQTTEFVVKLQDRFGNQVLKGVPTEQLSVEITGDAAPLAEVLPSFCTYRSRTKRLPCTNYEQFGVNGVWYDNVGLYRVTAAATVAGNYQVSVRLNDQPLAGSPTTKRITSGDADQARSFVRGENVRAVLAGDEGFFAVHARDNYGNALDKPFVVEASLTGPQPAAGIPELTSVARVDVSYLVTVAGAYELSVLLDTLPMSGSPFALTVSPGETAPFACIAEGAALTHAVAGFPGVFMIHARDAYGNTRTEGGDDMRVSVTGNSIVIGATEDLKNGSYVGSYDISIAGAYGLSLLVGTDEFLTSLLFCEAGPIDLEATTMQLPMPQRLVAGATVAYAAQARDKFGSKIGKCDEASAVAVRTLEANGTVAETNGTAACTNGMYSGAFTVQMTGQLGGGVRIAGGHIFGSPFAATVRAGPTAAHRCFATGDQLIIAGQRGPETGVAGKLATFTIHSRDAFGNKVLYDPFGGIDKFNVVLQLSGTLCDNAGNKVGDDAVCLKAGVKSNLDSTYSVTYVPEKSGRFQVVAALIDPAGVTRFISNSPFTSEVQPTVVEVRRTVALNAQPNVTVEAFSTFLVEARDRYDNRISKGGVRFEAFLTKSATAEEISPPVKDVRAIDLANGAYEMSFTVTASGRYNIEVMIDGTRIRTSPSPLRVDPGPLSLSDCTVSGNGVVGAFKGFRATFTIHARDRNGNQLAEGGAIFVVKIFTPADLTRDDGLATYLPPPIDQRDGTYTVTYLTTDVGAHKLLVHGIAPDNSEVLVRGGQVDQLNVIFDEGSPSIAGRSIAFGPGTVGAFAGQEASFVVQMRNAEGLNTRGGITVTTTLESAFDSPPQPVAVTQSINTDGTVSCTYSTRVAGMYTLTVRISGEDVLGSPYSVQVRPAESVALWSEVRAQNLLSIVGETVTFGVVAKDQFRNLQVYDAYKGPDAFEAKLVEANKGVEVVAKMQNNEDGTYIFSYSATVSGTYSLDVTLRGEPVDRFDELTVTSGVVTTDKCSAVGMSPVIVAGESRTLLISARDLFGNLVPEGFETFNVSVATATRSNVRGLGVASYCGPQQCIGAAARCPCPRGLTLGVYALTLALETAGSYTMSIIHNTFQIPGFPYAFTVDHSFAYTARTTVVGCEGVCSAQRPACSSSCIGCTCPVLATVQAGVEASFVLQSRDMFGNPFKQGRKAFRITARKRVPAGRTECLRSEGCVPAFVEGSVVDALDGTYRVSWVLAVLGEYDVAVTRSREHIEGSPFLMRVLPGEASSTTDGSTFVVDPLATAGETKTFLIQARDRFGNALTQGGEQFSVRLVGTSELLTGTSVVGQVEDYQDGSYLAWFKTVRAGGYDLEVRLNGRFVYPGPVPVTVIPARARADMSELSGTGLSAKQGAGDAALDSSFVPPEIRVIARDSYGNINNFDGLHIEVRVHGPQPRSLNSTDKSVSRYEDCGAGCGQYVFFNPLRLIGSYVLRVYLHNKDAFGRVTSSEQLTVPAGVAFDVSGAGTDAAQCFFAGAGAESCTADRTCSFQVQARDAFGNVLDQAGDVFEVSLTLVSSDATRLSYAGTVGPANRTAVGGLPHNSGLYDVRYAVTRSGTYTLQVTRYGQNVGGSPRNLLVAPGVVSAAATSASGFGITGGVYNSASPNTKLTFTVTARDRYGNIVEQPIILADLQQTVVSPNLAVPLAVNPFSTPGLYLVEYIPTKAQPYTISVFVGGANILGSPFVAQVLAASTQASNNAELLISYTTLEGEAARMISVGEARSFEVHPRRPDLSELPNSPWTYVIVITTPTQGDLECAACAGSLRVPASGVDCCVSQNQGNAALFPTVSVASTVAGMLRYTVYEESFVLKPLSGSPFSLQVLPGPTGAMNCTIETATEVPISLSTAGFPNQLRLVARDRYGNQQVYKPEAFGALTVTVSEVGGRVSAPLTLLDSADGSFSLLYTVTRAGRYAIDARLGGSPFRNSPAVVDVRPEALSVRFSDASFTGWQARPGAPTLARAGQPAEVTVQARDIYGNALTSDAAAFQVVMSGAGGAMTMPYYRGGGGYVANQVITVSGTYSMDVFAVAGGCTGPSDCSPISGSPFAISVGPASIAPALCLVSGPGKRSGRAGTRNAVTIVMRDGFANRVPAPPPGGRFELSVASQALPLSSGLYAYDQLGDTPVVVQGVITGVGAGGLETYYRVPMHGTYTMTVTYNGEEIGGTLGAAKPRPQVGLAYPPRIAGARFSDSGGHIYVEFAQPTDKANMEGAFPCSVVFEAFTVAVLGGAGAGGATCVFTTASLLDVILEFGATIQPNDDLYWNADVVRLAPACLSPGVCFKHSQAVQGTTRVSRPVDAIQPSAVLKAPPKVGPCDDVVLDASSSSGSGGRALQFYFGLEAGTSNDADVRAHILSTDAADAARTTPELRIPPSMLRPGEAYTFLVRAINFLDQSSVAQVTVLKAYDNGPVVDVEGPNRIYAKSSKAFKLRGSARLSSCNKVPGEVLFAWSVASVTPELPSPLALHSSHTTRQLYVPADTLLPGYVYELELRATMKNNASSYGLARVTVDCYFAPLIARVAGGNRAVAVDEELVLDASGSIDLDGAKSAEAFTFRWSCASAGGGTCFEDHMGLFLTSSPRLRVPSGTLLPGTYTFRVVASKEPGPRTAESDVVVYVQPLRMHDVEIEALEAYKFNANQVLQLKGDVAAGTDCVQQWSQLHGDDVLVHGTHLTTALSLLSIKFKSNALQPGASYRFRFEATCVVGGASAYGFSEVSVRMNSAPSSGQFFVSPMIGLASSTVFDMQLVNWVDDVEDLPFRYEFRYATQALPAEMIPLGEVDVNYMPATLPGPTDLALTEHMVMLYGKVIDQFAGVVTVSRAVVVQRPADAGARRRILAFSTAELDQAVLTQDAEKVIQLTSALATEPGLTCTARDGMIGTLQGVSQLIVMTATEIAGFQSALGSALAGTCVQDGVRRLLSDASVVQALGMTTSLLGSTISVGLDPTAESSSGGTLSSALDTLSAKNVRRRRLRELLGVRALHDPSRGVFRRRGGRQQTSSDPGNLLMGGLAGLAASQLNGAVTGEDARAIEKGGISMLASVATAQSFMGATLGAGAGRFSTPANLFGAGFGAPLSARTSTLAASPFESDMMLGGVSSLSFGVAVDQLQEPIELSMPATVSATGEITVHVCASTGASNAAEFPDASACIAACFDAPTLAPSAPPNASNATTGGNATGNATAGLVVGAAGTCSVSKRDSCGADLWEPCVNGEIDTCMFWNGEAWDGEGCIVARMDRVGGRLVCHCYHLTDFGGAASDVIPKMNVVDPTNPGALFANLSPDKILIICIVVGMLVMYWCLCYWGWRQDRIDNERMAADMGALSKKMQRRADELEQDEMMLNANNFALLEKAMKGQVGRSVLMIRNKALRIVRTKHKLFGGFFCGRTHYTRPRRFTVLFCMIIGNMVVNAIFAGADDTNFIQKIIGGILSALIMTPATIIFKKIFMSLGVDPKTRARWERDEAERFKQRRAELAMSVTTGPTASGIAAPPSYMKTQEAPRVHRGHVPNPDHEYMHGPQAAANDAAGPARFKRKQMAVAAPAQPPPPPTPSTMTSGSSFGGRPQPPPPPGPPQGFASAVPGVGADGEPNGEPIEAGAFIPRRALPLGGGARPPAPVMSTEHTNGNGHHAMADDDDFEGGERQEGMQESEVHTKKDDKDRPKESLEAKVAKAAVKALTKPTRELAMERKKKLMDHRFQYLAYVMAFIWYMVCCYFAILYGLKFSTAIEHAWLLAFFISLLQDLFINETLIISASTSVKYVVLPNIASWTAGRIVAKYK